MSEQGEAKEGSCELVDLKALQTEYKDLKKRIDEINHGVNPVCDEELARMKRRKLFLKCKIEEVLGDLITLDPRDQSPYDGRQVPEGVIIKDLPAFG